MESVEAGGDFEGCTEAATDRMGVAVAVEIRLADTEGALDENVEGLECDGVFLLGLGLFEFFADFEGSHWTSTVFVIVF